MKAREKAGLYRELAKLTEADFHLDRSLTLLLGQKQAEEKRAYLEGMQRGLHAGQGVGESIAENNRHLVGSLETALISAGERSGKLAAAFSHLARYFSAMDGAQKQARGALVYPLVLVHLAILLPEIPVAVTAEAGQGPGPRILLSLGVLWGLILAGRWGWGRLSEKARTSAVLDRVLNKIPFVGQVRDHWALARFCQVFHFGLVAALRVSETTVMAGAASQSGQYHAASLKAAAEIDASGEPLSVALADTEAFPVVFVNSVATAEEVGKLDEEMARWSAEENLLAHHAVERAALWLPKLGYGLIVGFVIYRIAMMLKGIYGGLYQMLE